MNNLPLPNKAIRLCLLAFITLQANTLLAAGNAPPSLKEIKVPKVENLKDFVADEGKARLMGKALFWDMQLGSDGQACASCHFHAGADLRVKNQLAPGLRRENNPDETFQQTASGDSGGPNYTLIEDDFPFHQFNDPDDRSSGVKFSTNDIASSQGTFGGDFQGVPDPGSNDDDCDRFPDPIFHVNGVGVRKVEARQTPSVINAVFNFRNFWDGRANNVFNGFDVFGLRNPGRQILKKDGSGVDLIQVDLRNSSLASQAVGPPRDNFEMSCADRKFRDIGRKMIPRRALATQKVHSKDSVLSGERDGSGLGLKKTYEELVKKAFKKEYWEVAGQFDGFTQMETNFSLFFGLSVQMYQSTLISEKAPYDAFADGKKEPFDPTKGKQDKLTDAQRRGLDVFLDKGKCINCHKGAEFSGAASVLKKENEENGLVERMIMGDGGVALYDNGFYNIGVTPTNEDIGVGGKDPFGNPLSFTEQFVNGNFVDPIDVDPCTFEVPFDSNDCSDIPGNLSNERRAVRGAFKVPILRNVELTGPYMHNGGMATLEQVVEFYDRGGNFRNDELDPDIQSLGLSAQEKADLVAFLKALTDPRVTNESKPFDHPQLWVPHGHPGDENSVEDANGDGLADNKLVEIPAIGDGGRSKEGFPPLQTFLNVDFEQQLVNSCAQGKPLSLQFMYTGESCSATTNFQDGKVICSGDPGEAQPIQIVMTKDADKVIPAPSSETINIGDLVTIAKNDGKELPKDTKLDIRQGGNVLQSLTLKTDCSKPLNVGDRFGGLLLQAFTPK